MKNIARIALALAVGSVSVASSSASFAREDLPNGSYGDPGVATFTETSSGASISFACEGAKFDGPIVLEGRDFTALGTYGSTLQSQSQWAPVVMTGSLTEGSCNATGACFPTTLKVTLTRAANGTHIGTWTFVAGDTGVTFHCG